VLRDAGMTPEQIQAAVRIASAVHAVAVTLEAERTLQTQPLAQAAVVCLTTWAGSGPLWPIPGSSAARTSASPGS
jgi:hypothetical protein